MCPWLSGSTDPNHSHHLSPNPHPALTSWRSLHCHAPLLPLPPTTGQSLTKACESIPLIALESASFSPPTPNPCSGQATAVTQLALLPSSSSHWRAFTCPSVHVTSLAEPVPRSLLPPNKVYTSKTGLESPRDMALPPLATASPTTHPTPMLQVLRSSQI